jgi:hypothetical protein
MEIDIALKIANRAAAAVRRSEARLDEAVAEARQAGATWTQIGMAVGISRQAAHERWGHMPRPEVCQRTDCDCPDHRAASCPCGHGPGRGYRTLQLN